MRFLLSCLMACLLFGCNKTENDIEHEFSVGQLKNDFEVYRKVLEKGHLH
jgi:hypothetical protein